MTITPGQLIAGASLAYVGTAAITGAPMTIAADSFDVNLPTGSLTAEEANATTGNAVEAIRVLLEMIYLATTGSPNTVGGDYAMSKQTRNIVPNKEEVSYEFYFTVNRGTSNDLLGKDTL